MHTANAHKCEVLIQISRDSLAPCIWRAEFLCSCNVMNCADSDHFCRWFSGLRFVYQIMSQWFIIIIRVVIKSNPNKSRRQSQVSSPSISSPSQVESFSLFSQASQTPVKSCDLYKSVLYSNYFSINYNCFYNIYYHYYYYIEIIYNNYK